ncbi:MAG: hypothetical protein HN348_19200, partial [Proteobacteria bacterium]|nr:hypothetical protein [Pseudomonadota bacterium]
YIYRGKGIIASQSVERGRLVVLGDGDSAQVETGDGPLAFILGAAQPLDEPIARHGPFVMNTWRQIDQAILDYQRGNLVG